MFDCGKSSTRIDLTADVPREVRAAGDRQTTGDSGGGTQGRDRSPQGEQAGEETQPPQNNGHSSAVVSARIRGCGQTNIMGESTGPQGQPPVHASVSNGSAMFLSATFGRSDFVSQQLFQSVEQLVEYDFIVLISRFIVLISRRKRARWKRTPRFSTGCFGAGFAFAAQQPDLPGTADAVAGRFGQQQRPAA